MSYAADPLSEVARLRALLAQAQVALGTCKMHYSETSQFSGEWAAQFDEKAVIQALTDVNQELGLPPPDKSKFAC